MIIERLDKMSILEFAEAVEKINSSFSKMMPYDNLNGEDKDFIRKQYKYAMNALSIKGMIIGISHDEKILEEI